MRKIVFIVFGLCLLLSSWRTDGSQLLLAKNILYNFKIVPSDSAMMQENERQITSMIFDLFKAKGDSVIGYMRSGNCMTGSGISVKSFDPKERYSPTYAKALEAKKIPGHRAGSIEFDSLMFREHWTFDGGHNRFVKRVTGILIKVKGGEETVFSSELLVPLNEADKNVEKSKLIATDVLYDVHVSGDGAVDDETCWYQNRMEASLRQDFFEHLQGKILNDTLLPLTAYQPYWPYNTVIPRTGVRNQGVEDLYYGLQTWRSSDFLVLGHTYESLKHFKFDLDDWSTVKGIRFHEDWYYDKEKQALSKVVKGIGLIVNTYDETGEKVVGEKCLMYVKLYPIN